jgi:hypothetical protein
MQNTSHEILTSLAWSIPFYVIYLVAAVIAIVRWSRHPSASLLVLLAVIMLTLTALFGDTAFTLALHAREDAGWTNEQLGSVMAALRLVRNLFTALGLALLVSAVFTGRSARNSQSPTF